MTLLEIDLKKLEYNYFSLRKKLNPHTKMIGVVKSNAYGSLSGPIAQKLVELGIESLAVAYASEGIQLLEYGIQIPILVFYPPIESFKEIILHNLEPVLYSKRSLKEFVHQVSSHKKTAYPIHIKYNTGLNRIGFSTQDVEWVIE